MEQVYSVPVYFFEELRHAETEHRMHQGWSNICQWDENKGPLVQAWVRDNEWGSIQDEIIVKENIQVDQARAVAEAGNPPQRGLDTL